MYSVSLISQYCMPFQSYCKHSHGHTSQVYLSYWYKYIYICTFDNIRKWMMSLLRIGVIEHFMSQWCRWRQLFFSNCLMGIITSLLIKKPIHIWISRIWLHQNSVGKNPLQSKKLGSTAPNIFTFKYPLFFSLGLDRKFGLKQRKRKLRSVDSSLYPKKHTSWSER